MEHGSFSSSSPSTSSASTMESSSGGGDDNAGTQQPPELSSTLPSSFGKLLSELMEWNNRGIHYVTFDEIPMTSAESVAGAHAQNFQDQEQQQHVPQQQQQQQDHDRTSCKVQWNDGLSCFRKAFQLASEYCLSKKTQMVLLMLQLNQDTITTLNLNGTIAELRIGLAEESIFRNVHRSNRNRRSSSDYEDFTEFLFTRPFTISTTNPNRNEDCTAFDSPSSVLPCAVIAFNMALMHQLLAMTSATVEASRVTHILRQSVCLYQTCWGLVKTLTKNDDGARGGGGRFAFAPPKRRRIAGVATVADDQLLEVLGMAALNNMVIASYELADYNTSYDLSYRLRVMLSSSVYFQHQCVMESSLTYPIIQRLRTSSTTTNTTIPTSTEQESLYHESNNGTNYDQSIDQQVNETIPPAPPAASNLNQERWNFMLNTVVFTMPTLVAPSA